MKLLLFSCICFAFIGGVFCQSCASVGNLVASTLVSQPDKIVLNWNLSNSTNVEQYDVIYRSLSHSGNERTVSVTASSMSSSMSPTLTLTLMDLLHFTTYSVSVRAVCGGEMSLPTIKIVTTLASAPSARVENLRVNSSDSNPNLVRLQWQPLNDSRWNGIPRFYDVSIFASPARDATQIHRVHFPSTDLLLRLNQGEYGATVAAVNNVNSSDMTAMLMFKVGGTGDSSSVTDYPYFYIIIPGIIFLAFIIVITIVIFKKVHESRKQSVTYVRDINDKVNYGGFNNAMPMRELSPQSPNTSTSLPVSSSTITNASPYPHPHQQMATRPLPLSPANPSLIPAEDPAHFSMNHPAPGHMTSSNSAGALKLTSSGANYPGPLPSLHENVELSGGYPITRTMTDQSLGNSVFSPNSATSMPLAHVTPIPQQQQDSRPQFRGRSNTLGGIPSPYEVPDTNNGNTLPHDLRPSSAHPNMQQRNNGGDLGGNFPPPPPHSPPIINNHNLGGDVRPIPSQDHAHMPHGGHHSHHHGHTQPQQQHPGGNTLPRSIPNQRSFSTSASHGRMVADPRGGMTSMRSEGNIPSPPDNDNSVFNTQSSTGADGTVYIQPPLDSDFELQSTSSYGETGGVGPGRHQSLDRGRHAHNNISSNAPPPHFPQQSRHPGMLNGPLESGERFNRLEGEGMVVPAHIVADPQHERSAKEKATSRRESLFSETSTELSMTSGSDKEMSPSGGWDHDHRATKSDVGVSHNRHRQHRRHHHDRHHRSNTPPERDFQANGFV